MVGDLLFGGVTLVVGEEVEEMGEVGEEVGEVWSIWKQCSGWKQLCVETAPCSGYRSTSTVGTLARVLAEGMFWIRKDPLLFLVDTRLSV